MEFSVAATPVHMARQDGTTDTGDELMSDTEAD